jgi:hypothetical protein
MSPGSHIAGALAVTLLLAVLPNAHGQDSRAAEVAAEQDRKAANLHPYRRAFSPSPAVLPYFGRVYPGGSFTVGAGYRQFFGDNTL